MYEIMKCYVTGQVRGITKKGCCIFSHIYNTVLVFGKIFGSRVVASAVRAVAAIKNNHAELQRESNETDKFNSAEVDMLLALQTTEFKPWRLDVSHCGGFLCFIIYQFLMQLLIVCSDDRESLMVLHLL